MKRHFTYILIIAALFSSLFSQSLYKLDTTKISLVIQKMIDTSLTDPLTALNIFDQIENTVIEEGTPKEKVLLYLRIAPVYHLIGNHSKSLDMFFKALSISNKNSLGMQSGIYNNMTMVFAETGNSDLYFSILNDALMYAIENNESDFTLGIIYNNFADYYREILAYDSALVSLNRSLVYLKKSGVEININSAIVDLARVYLLMGDYKKGIAEAGKAYEYFNRSENRAETARAAMMLGFNLYKSGRIAEATKYLNIAKSIARSNSLDDVLLLLNEYNYRFVSNYNKITSFNNYKVISDSLNFAKHNKKNSILLDRLENDKLIAEKHAAEIARGEEKEISFIIVMVLLTILGIVLGTGLHKRNLLNKKLLDHSRELEILNKKFTSFVNQSSNAIKILDLDGNIIYVNKVFEKISGLDREAIIGLDNSDLMTKFIPVELQIADYKTISEAIKIEFKQNKNFGLTTYEFQLKSCENNLYFFEDTFFPIISGDLYMIGVVSSDITLTKKYERKLIEAKQNAEKSDKLKTNFLAQMSHEIRTPINAILSMVKIVELEANKCSDPGLNDCFNSIENASTRLIRTIDSILNMSEVQTGAYIVLPRRFYLFKDLIQPLLTEFRIAAELKKIKFEIEDSLPNTEVFLDHYSMTQVISNLLDNAIKYTEEGEIKISINKNNRQKTEIKITDTGVGISEEFISDIFDPFTQEQQGYSRRFDGTGLGLALAKKYCDLNMVKIDVQSTKNVGTTFRLII